MMLYVLQFTQEMSAVTSLSHMSKHFKIFHVLFEKKTSHTWMEGTFRVRLGDIITRVRGKVKLVKTSSRLQNSIHTENIGKCAENSKRKKLRTTNLSHRLHSTGHIFQREDSYNDMTGELRATDHTCQCAVCSWAATVENVHHKVFVENISKLLLETGLIRAARKKPEHQANVPKPK